MAITIVILWLYRFVNGMLKLYSVFSSNLHFADGTVEGGFDGHKNGLVLYVADRYASMARRLWSIHSLRTVRLLPTSDRCAYVHISPLG